MYLIRTHSAGYAYGIKNNSNAIVLAMDRLSEVDTALENITIGTNPYTLTYDLYLSSNHTASVSVDCILNGGGHAICFARSATNVLQVAASRTLTLQNVVLRNFSDGAIQLGSGASVVFGDGVYIELEEEETLSRNWTFSGSCTLYGGGNKLILDNYYVGILSPGSLRLNNVIVDGLKSNNVRCIGNNATLYLRDTNLLLSNNFCFTTGALQFEHDVVMTGTNIFSYETSKASTIATESTLFLDTGVTFSYAPISFGRDLFSMTDATSRLFLNGCTLKSTTAGMRLIKGTLLIDHKNNIYNDGATTDSQSVSFGNGTAASDLSIEIYPEGSIELQTGRLLYANAN
jgi:hypothetical protein